MLVRVLMPVEETETLHAPSMQADIADVQFARHVDADCESG